MAWTALDFKSPPDHFDSPERRCWRMLDASGSVFEARQAYFNNSGWVETGTNREVWPVYWFDPTPTEETEG